MGAPPELRGRTSDGLEFDGPACSDPQVLALGLSFEEALGRVGTPYTALITQANTGGSLETSGRGPAGALNRRAARTRASSSQPPGD